jgi:dipeptide/tripeptide permease
MASVLSTGDKYTLPEDPGSDKTSETQQANDENRRTRVSGKAWGRVWQFLTCRGARFPPSIFFIVGNEFCERFSYYGMRAVLTLYLWRFLGFEKDTATAFYHGFIVLCYCAPVLGAIIADSCLGKFTTIISLSIVYAIGNIAVSLAAIPPVFNYSLDGERAMTFVGLILIALGTGGIKPCVSAFGGDQFKEEQKSLLPKFFSIFYFSINAGSLISTFLTPIFRADVQCFGQDCYALAFGIPAGLMIVSLIIFIIGSPLYIKHRPQCGKFWELVIFKFLISSILIVYKGIVMCVKVTVGKVTGRVLWKPSSSIYQTAEAKYGVRSPMRVV